MRNVPNLAAPAKDDVAWSRQTATRLFIVELLTSTKEEIFPPWIEFNVQQLLKSAETIAVSSALQKRVVSRHAPWRMNTCCPVSVVRFASLAGPTYMLMFRLPPIDMPCWEAPAVLPYCRLITPWPACDMSSARMSAT